MNVFTLETYFLTSKVIFSFTVGSRSVGNTLSPSKVTCLRKLEKLHSETRNSSTILENAQYGTEEKQKGNKKQIELYLAYFNYYLSNRRKEIS